MQEKIKASKQRKGLGAELPHVELEQTADQPVPVQQGMVQIGKIPGEIVDVPLKGSQTIGDLFKGAGLDVQSCDIQVNGASADLNQIAKPGDVIFAITKIRGNVFF